MEGGDTSAVPPPAAAYRLQPCLLMSEDILFCVDADVESQVEMKVLGPRGRPVTRMEAIKQALTLFVNAKHSINSDHRFAFSTLGKSFAWLRREFNNEVDSAIAAVRALRATDSSYGLADLTQLFVSATNEAKKSRSQGRLLRVILVYCRSSIRPQHQWPVSPKLFTLDVVYLHDKPSPENCPQKVYDVLTDAVDHVSEHEGYIFESGLGLSRVLFRHVCTLLSHQQQRCVQDELDIPKPLTRKPQPSPTDVGPGDEGLPVVAV